MRIIATTALLGLLAACGSNKDDTTADGEEISITNEDGETFTISETSGRDAAWPEGFSAYPGAMEVTNTTMGTDEAASHVITFESKDPFDQIVDFYRKQATAAGFKITMDIKVDNGQMLTGESSDGRTLSLSTETVSDAVDVILSVTAKEMRVSSGSKPKQ